MHKPAAAEAVLTVIKSFISLEMFGGNMKMTRLKHDFCQIKHSSSFVSFQGACRRTLVLFKTVWLTVFLCFQSLRPAKQHLTVIYLQFAFKFIV